MTLADFRGTAFFFAVERESSAFFRSFPESPRPLGKVGWLIGNPPVFVGLLGVGKPSARKVIEHFLESAARPDRIIVAGFAGALRSGLALGEVIVASEVVDETRIWRTTWPNERAGRVFTSQRMIGDPVEKKKLGTELHADVVDMESAAVAEMCAKHGIPFGCVRVVSDDVNRPLSQRLMGIVESGRVSIPRVLWEVVRSPRLGLELIRLARHTRFSADSLTRKLRELLDG